jgi:hypothetical protein
MKTMLALTLMLSSAAAFAGEVNPFDPANACGGPTMSAERALEILGSSFSVNHAKGEKESMIQGASRFRQVINGVRGGWNASLNDHFPIAPFLANVDGKIGLEVFVYQWNGARYSYFRMLCSYQEDTETFFCQNKDVTAPKFGTNAFEAKLTDSCFSMVSRFESAAQEREWAFTLQF